MKRLLFLILLLPCLVYGQTVGIKVASPIIKNSPSDNTVTGYADLLNGGYHIVTSLAGRDSLNTAYSKTLKVNMLCYVGGGVDSTYRWDGTVWNPVASGGVSLSQLTDSLSNYLKNKTKESSVYLIGDSFTELNIPQSGLNYLKLVVTSNGIGGSCITGGTSNAEGDGTLRTPFTKRIDAAITANPNIIIIEGGSNDFHYNTTIGSITSTDTTTFCGSLNYIFKKTSMAGIKTILITPTFRADSQKTGGSTGEGNWVIMSQYVDAMKYIASYWGINVIDEFYGSGINYYNTSIYTTDGVHPNNVAGSNVYNTFLINNFYKSTSLPSSVFIGGSPIANRISQRINSFTAVGNIQQLDITNNLNVTPYGNIRDNSGYGSTRFVSNSSDDNNHNSLNFSFFNTSGVEKYAMLSNLDSIGNKPLFNFFGNSFFGNNGTSFITPKALLNISGGSNSTPAILLDDGSSLLTTPQNGAIERYGDYIYFTSAGVRKRFTFSNTTNYLPKSNGTDFSNSKIYDNGTNVSIGTTSPFSNFDFHVVNPSGSSLIGISNESSASPKSLRLGFLSSSGNATIQGTHAGVADDVDVVMQLGGGNVGVGTNPTEKLEVNGNAKATSFIKSGGTSSQFLKADGSSDGTTYASTSYADAKVQNSLTASTTIAPSATAVNTGLATRENPLTFTLPLVRSTNTITVNAATTSASGIVSISSQTFAGQKEFQDSTILNNMRFKALAGMGGGALVVDNTGKPSVAVMADRTLSNKLAKTSAYTVTLSDFGANGELILEVDATAGAVTITLPSLANMTGVKLMVFKTDSSINAVTISGAVNINGSSTASLATQWASTTITGGTSVYLAK